MPTLQSSAVSMCACVCVCVCVCVRSLEKALEVTKRLSFFRHKKNKKGKNTGKQASVKTSTNTYRYKLMELYKEKRQYNNNSK